MHGEVVNGLDLQADGWICRPNPDLQTQLSFFYKAHMQSALYTPRFSTYH